MAKSSQEIIEALVEHIKLDYVRKAIDEGGESSRVALSMLREEKRESLAYLPTKGDPNSIASIMTGGANYTVEPTTVASVFAWEGSINSRGTLIKEFQPGEGPLWGPNQTMLLQATPGAASAVQLSVTLEFEEGF